MKKISPERFAELIWDRHLAGWSAYKLSKRGLVTYHDGFHHVFASYYMVSKSIRERLDLELKREWLNLSPI